MANMGLGIGSFLSGLAGGVQMGSQIQDAKDRKRMRGLQMDQMEQDYADKQNLRGIMRQAATDAGAQRQADIDKNITVGSAETSDMTVPTYNVGSRQYASKDEADKAASKDVDSFLDYYMGTSAPKLMQHWAETGQLDKAQAFDKFAQDADARKGMKAWAGAVRSFQLGDREGFKDNLLKAYNQKGYFEDGYTATKIDDVKNDKGQLLGYAITFKDGDGNETTQTYDGDDVAQMGLQAMAPDQVLSYGLEQLKAKQATQAQLAKESRGLSNDLLKIGVQQGNTLESQNNQSNLRRLEEQEKIRQGGGTSKVSQANAVANALRANGMAEADVRALYPQLLGVERASRSRQDRLDGYIASLSKASMDFNDLSTAEKVAQAQALMDSVDGAAKPQAPAQSGRAASAGNPVQSGRGVPLIDTKTNQIFYQ